MHALNLGPWARAGGIAVISLEDLKFASHKIDEKVERERLLLSKLLGTFYVPFPCLLLRSLVAFSLGDSSSRGLPVPCEESRSLARLCRLHKCRPARSARNRLIERLVVSRVKTKATLADCSENPAVSSQTMCHS